MAASKQGVKALASTKDLSVTEWLQLRRRGIGGSDAPKVLGLVPYPNATPYALWRDKIGEPEPGFSGDGGDPSEAAMWGNLLEDVVAKQLAKVAGLRLARKNVIYQDATYPYMIGNVDRVVVGDVTTGVEIKTASAYKASEWRDDNVPDAYWVQCQHYMRVLGWERMIIAVLIGGQRMVYKEIARDNQFIEKLVEIEGDFWNKVIRREPPAMIAADDPALWYPAPTSEVLAPATEEIEAVVQSLRSVRRQIKTMEEEEARLTVRVKDYIGEAEGIEGLCTWKKSKPRQSVDWERLAKDHLTVTPELMAQYTQAKDGARVLRLLEPKKEEI